MATATAKLAVWVVTPNGMNLAQKIKDGFESPHLFYSKRLETIATSGEVFSRLTEAVTSRFHHYRNHVFIMSAGIVVRAIAPLIVHKTTDPAVVVIDDKGQHVISLLSGHLGGANQLACTIAALLGAKPVITTATDINHKPAIDNIAKQKELRIENPHAIKQVNMALLTDAPVWVYDPHRLLKGQLPHLKPIDGRGESHFNIPSTQAGIFLDDRCCTLPSHFLKLRPQTLVAGIGCNRDTPKKEIKELLFKTLDRFALSPFSLGSLASIDVKSDEVGILDLAEELNLKIQFFPKETLNQVSGVQTPSAMVAKHVGVKNVCETAAIVASQNGQLIVPKQKTPNVTVAIARRDFM